MMFKAFFSYYLTKKISPLEKLQLSFIPELEISPVCLYSMRQQLSEKHQKGKRFFSQVLNSVQSLF